MTSFPPESDAPRIVAFTKDWDDVPTCTTHILRGMGRRMPVLWVGSIGTRKPGWRGGSDRGRLLRRLRKATAHAEHKENRLRVLNPLLIPKAQSGAARAINRGIMATHLRRELAAMGEGLIEYWCFVPNAVDLVAGSFVAEPTRAGRNPTAKLVYYCVDDWSQFHNLDGAWLSGKEAQLIERANVVFAPARLLVDKCRSLGAGNVHYVPHGVEYGKFARALDSSLAVPADIAALPRPLVGFYGNIHSWIDFNLLERLAEARPQWSFVLIGEVFCDVTRLERIPNVHLVGRREHAELPAYCRGFDAAMIPYDCRNPRMESVNPVKAKELLAAGVPVVATDIPELHGYGDAVRLCATDDEWLAALEAQRQRTDRRQLSDRMKPHDWSHRIDAIRRIVDGC